MRLRRCFVLSVISTALFMPGVHGQNSATTFTRADTLRGMLTPLRTCYDVRFYHLDVTIDPESRSIRGSNTIRFDAVRPFTTCQIDLFENLSIDGITFEGAPLTFDREINAVYVHFPRMVEGSSHEMTIAYSGTPVVAARPPWNGGFTWEKDSKGKPWVVVTCQGVGASIWWPNKDHQSDEPDSMLISVSVPPGLQDVSNGRLRATTTLDGGWTRYDWFVANPINNYDVTLNVADYAHFSDTYRGALSLDYYVLPEDLDRARSQFTQVQTMLACFEHFFGPYPFPEDGYKLVECPHPGMEHQSAVAYGNHFINGYGGSWSSPPGLTFDFIIIHESAHEWWGNSVTAGDEADMWIHESFAAYAEALYVEYTLGRATSLEYINARKQDVANQKPVIGPYNVNTSGADMYDKGQLVLNTLRSVIDNDSLWFSILKGLATTFRHAIVDAEDFFRYINQRAGTDLDYFFNQYFRYPHLPVLEATVTQKAESTVVKCRWKADVADFSMPMEIVVAPGRTLRITPTSEWQTMNLGSVDPRQFDVAEDLFYVGTHIRRIYVDPRARGMGRE